MVLILGPLCCVIGFVPWSWFLSFELVLSLGRWLMVCPLVLVLVPGYMGCGSWYWFLVLALKKGEFLELSGGTGLLSYLGSSQPVIGY